MKQKGVVIDKSAAVRIATSIGWEPKREWVGLSLFEINDLVDNTEYEDYRDLVKRTEEKLKEKNEITGEKK